MQSSLQHTIRATAVIVGILFTGAALADSKSTTSNDEAANCANNASIQYSIDSAQCGMYPSYTEIYGNCMANAASKWSITSAQCGTGNASATLTTSGEDGNGGGGQKGKFRQGQFGRPTGGLSIGANNDGGDKPAKFGVGKLGAFRTFGG